MQEPSRGREVGEFFTLAIKIFLDIKHNVVYFGCGYIKKAVPPPAR